MSRTEIDPIWIDARAVYRMFSLGRTTLGRLEREKKIVACSLAEPGMKRGKKLYQRTSIEDYLNLRATATAREAIPA